jgi:5-methylcytosine-specific restriction protein A
MARNFVSGDHALVAFALAMEVERGSMSRSAATQSLIGDYGFRPHTANAYIDCYFHLRAGTTWKATISDAAVRMMLDVIASQGGNALFMALQSIQGHINYFAGRGSRRPSLVAVLEDYKRELAASTALMPADVSLENQVRLSAEDSADSFRTPISSQS